MENENVTEKRYKEDIETQNERWQEELKDRKENPVKYMAMSGIKKRFLNATLEGITSKLPSRIEKKARRFLKDKDGLFNTGVRGCGKTYVSAAIARELIIRGDKVNFITVPKLLQDIRATFGKKNKEDESYIINKYSGIPYLILDDLGAEKMSDFSLDRLYLIIDARYSEELPIIITSNKSLDGISSDIHDRIASRIAGSCKIIQFPNIDLRINK